MGTPSVAALVAVQVFARSRQVGFFGLSAIIALVALSAVFVLGVRRRSRSVRKRVWLGCGGALVGAVLAMAGLAIAGLAARAPLEEGNRQAHTRADRLNAGDIPKAATAFRAAAAAFAKADDDLSAPWAQPGRLMPMVAQNRDALAGLTAQGPMIWELPPYRPVGHRHEHAAGRQRAPSREGLTFPGRPRSRYAADWASWGAG